MAPTVVTPNLMAIGKLTRLTQTELHKEVEEEEEEDEEEEPRAEEGVKLPTGRRIHLLGKSLL